MVLAKKNGTDIKNPNHRKDGEFGENITDRTKRVMVVVTLKMENAQLSFTLPEQTDIPD